MFVLMQDFKTNTQTNLNQALNSPMFKTCKHTNNLFSYKQCTCYINTSYFIQNYTTVIGTENNNATK